MECPDVSELLEGGSSRQTVIIVDDGQVRSRLLSAREAARLMGAPESFRLPAGYNQAYKAMGDAVAVPVVSWLSRHLLEPLAKLAASTRHNEQQHPEVYEHIARTEKRASEWTVELKRKAMKDIEQKTIAALGEWFAYEQDDLAEDSDRYVVCAGLAVAQALKAAFPLEESDYITPRNQVKPGGLS